MMKPMLTMMMMTAAGCGTEPVLLTYVFLDTVGGGGPVHCDAMCSYIYEDDSVVLSAATSPCEPGDDGCASCDSCKALVAYHASQGSCDDGLNGGRVVIVEAVDCL